MEKNVSGVAGLAGERSVGEVARWRGGEFGTESVQWQRAGWEVDVMSSWMWWWCGGGCGGCGGGGSGGGGCGGGSNVSC